MSARNGDKSRFNSNISTEAHRLYPRGSLPRITSLRAARSDLDDAATIENRSDDSQDTTRHNDQLNRS